MAVAVPPLAALPEVVVVVRTMAADPPTLLHLVALAVARTMVAAVADHIAVVAASSLP